MEALIAVVAVFAVAVPVLAIVSSSAADRRHARTRARLAAVEQKLDLVIQHLGIQVPGSATLTPAPGSADFADVLENARHGRKIQAIKIYRERTGVSLAEAKAAVENMTP